MSSTILKAINTIQSDKHAVGNLNNWNNDVVNEGAMVADATIENFSVVELGFDAITGERNCKYLTDQTQKGYLIAAVEDYMEEWGEDVGNFYNEKGERARIVILNPRLTRIDVSNFKLDDTAVGALAIANNQKVFWDVTKKAYVVCNGASVNASYATAGNKFVVVSADSGTLDGQKLIRLEVVA